MEAEVSINSVPLAAVIVGIALLILVPIGVYRAGPRTYRLIYRRMVSEMGTDQLKLWWNQPLVWFFSNALRASFLMRTFVVTGALAGYTAAFVSAPAKYIAIAGFLVCIPLGGWLYYAMVLPSYQSTAHNDDPEPQTPTNT
jgi:hypothetical protein